jgi:hypothetical protein
LAARDGATLTLTDLTVERRSDQALPVTCILVDGPSTLVIDNVRVANCNDGGILINGDGYDTGISDYLTNVTIVDSIIENNTQAPGVTNDAAELTVSNSAIRGNQNPNGNGGGILNYGGSAGTAYALVTDSIIENNTAHRGGGIYTGDDGPDTKADVYRSLIRNNVANLDGGGYYSRGQFFMNGTTVTGNWANERGAGIYHEGAEFQIQQTTISGNGGTRNGVTTLLGGGVWASGGNRLFIQSIVANNTSFAHSDVSAENIIGDSYNLIEDAFGSSGFGGTDILGQDPQLGSLQSLGGPTRVLPLLAGSPAIDRIPTSSTPPSNVDQRGSPRTASGSPRNGDDGSGLVGYDIGAFEQGAFESEFLNVAAKTSSVTHSIIANANYSKSEGTRLHANANGHLVTYAVPVLSSGTYSFLLRVRRGSDRGIYQVATSNSPTTGFTNRGPTQDLYNASQQFSELTLSGATVTFATAGTKYIRFTVTGKNAASSSRNLYLDWVQLVKAP